MSSKSSENSPGPVRHAFPSEPLFERIVAAFTTRRLADRSSSDKDLNTGLHTGDDPLNVLENRRLIFGALNLESDSFTAARQVHGDAVHSVTEADRGRGAHRYKDAIPDTDALITDMPGIPIGVFTADCVPIFLYDPERPAVGIAHAGWRGTVRSIAEKTIQRMQREFGSPPDQMWAAIGPSIGPCCYEVGADVHSSFSEAFSYASTLFVPKRDEKWHLDLWLANRRQLEGCGVSPERIVDTRICSACNAYTYFSARKHGVRAGRTLSVIAIKPS